MKTTIIRLSIATLLFSLILTGCKKPKIVEPEMKDTKIEYHLKYNTPQKKYWILVQGEYKDRQDYYLRRTYEVPKDTIITLPKAKLIKSTFELATINGQADVEVTVYVNGAIVEVLHPNSYDKIYYKWQ